MNIVIDGMAIKRVRTYRYFGLALDENISFDAHVDHIKKIMRPFVEEWEICNLYRRTNGSKYNTHKLAKPM